MKKFISTAVLAAILSFNLISPSLAWGQESPPPAPDAPSAPSAPTSAPVPTAPPPPTITAPTIAPASDSQLTPMPSPSQATATPTETPAATNTPTPAAETTSPNGQNTASGNQPAADTPTSPTPTTQNSQIIKNGQTGNTIINSGNSNVSGTAISAANTNIANLATSEFSVADDHQGNIILDPASGCTSGCNNIIGSNGSDSNNTLGSTNNESSNNTQNNTANIGNELVLAANSGDNSASYTTNGDSIIKTGDANVSANSITLANNNLEGKILYQTVNIYGDLKGDIVLPEEAYNSIGGNGANANSNSQNSNIPTSPEASLGASKTNSNNQNNNADINNQIETSANTGGNNTGYNTNGDSSVTTGNSNTQVKTLNVANNNIGPGNWWIVIINKAGEWIGDVVGGQSSNLASKSEGDTTTVSNNGTESNNQASTTNSQTESNTQNNSANVGNKLKLSANTGRNTASYNTGGDSKIQTGNANIIANVSNFVNNNIAAGGKLIITVVNIFGKWAGNFVPPGQQAASNTPTPATTSTSPTPAATATTANNSTSSPTQAPMPTTPPAQATFAPNAIGWLQRNYAQPSPTPEPIAMQPETSNSTAQVLGAQAENPANKSIDINLAWLLFGLPVAIGAGIKQLLH